MSARASAIARVRRVLAVGARIADAEGPLGREARDELTRTSGLSREGVELALSTHLETSATEHELEALLAHAGDAPRCHVVLSANVCTGALRATALALATAPSVLCRPSRRDPVLATLLARALASDQALADAAGRVDIVADVHPDPGDELHVYGTDEAIRAVAAAAPASVVVRGHGTGMGLAVVDATADLGAAAEAIARDVVPFDQRGCLSPRAVLVAGDRARARAFATELHRALGSIGTDVPRGELDAPERAAVSSYRATLQAIGELWEGSSHVVGLDADPRSLVLPPPARVVHVAPARDALLARSWAPFLTCIGGTPGAPLTESAAALAPLARRCLLGFMQRPPLDGPVDRRGHGGVHRIQP